MNDTGTVFDGDIVGAGYIKRLLIHLNKRHELMIFQILKLPALHYGQNFIGIGSQDLVCKGFGNVIYPALLCSALI